MTNLYCINYTTNGVIGIQKIKVIATCENDAIEKLKAYECEHINYLKITKTEKVLI